MAHFKILIDVFALVLGSGIAVTLLRSDRSSDHGGMRALGLFLVFHNLLIVADLGYRYWFVNIIDNDLSVFSSAMIVALLMFRIGADTGYTWYLFSAFRRFRGLKTNPVLLVVLLASALIVLALSGRGISEYRSTGSIEGPVRILEIWILAVLVLVFAILLAALAATRSLFPIERRRSLRRLTVCLLIAYGLILLDELSFYRLGIEGIDLGNLPVLVVNLVVLVWLWRWSAPYPKGAASSRPVPLDELSEAFGISRREMEVVEQLLAGKSNKEIQQALFISPSTVKNHLTNIYRKIGVDSRTRLIAALQRRRDEGPDA